MPLSWESSREGLRKAINIIFNWAQKNAMFRKGGDLGDETRHTIVAKHCLAQTSYLQISLKSLNVVVLHKVVWKYRILPRA